MAQQPRSRTGADEARRERTVAIMTAPAWMPNPGDSFTGTCVSVQGRNMKDPAWTNPDGLGVYPVLTYELDTPFEKDGETVRFVQLHAFHTSLYNQLKEKQEKVGSRTTVAYGGKHVKKGFEDAPEGKKQYVQHYKAFDPDADVEGGSFDWGTSVNGDPDF